MYASPALWLFPQVERVGTWEGCGCDHVCLKTTHLLNWDKERNGFMLMFAPTNDNTHTHAHTTYLASHNQHPHEL